MCLALLLGSNEDRGVNIFETDSGNTPPMQHNLGHVRQDFLVGFASWEEPANATRGHQ